jgi:hypothetical protein
VIARQRSRQSSPGTSPRTAHDAAYSVFAEPLRGTAEGHYPWDLMPGSSMTNAAVTKQLSFRQTLWLLI